MVMVIVVGFEFINVLVINADNGFRLFGCDLLHDAGSLPYCNSEFQIYDFEDEIDSAIDFET